MNLVKVLGEFFWVMKDERVFIKFRGGKDVWKSEYSFSKGLEVGECMEVLGV